MEIHAWMWIDLSLVLAVVAIAIMNLYALWFALGALVLGLLTWVWPEVPQVGQVLAWVALSSLMALVSFKVRPS